MTETVVERAIALIGGAVVQSEEQAPETVSDVSQGGSFIIPVMIPEETESGDGRMFTKGSISHRDLPIPLLWQIATDDGHDSSYIVGRIDSLDMKGDGSGLTNARGVFDSGLYGREAERMVRNQMLRGVSADMDQFEASATDDTDTAESGKIKNDKVIVTKARAMAATLVPKPAFQECLIKMDDESSTELPADGVYTDDVPESDALQTNLAAIAASAAPVHPPSEWFVAPDVDRLTPITVSDSGRVFGHIASWDSSHIGLAAVTPPPRSASNYAYFKTGVLRTEEGDDVSVGQLTLAGGHAPLHADAASAVRHYDDTASAMADVTAGEDQFGIWVAGALRPGVTPEQVRSLRASAPSGDWRPIKNRLELVAICQVNVPGFPVTRTMVAGGQVTALVAAGAQSMAMLRDEPIRELAFRVSAIEQAELATRRASARARIAPVVASRQAALTASAAAAREKIQPLLDERTALLASVEESRNKITEFKLSVAPEFEEAEHPRLDDGKFKEVLLHLSDVMDNVSGADEATKTVKAASEHAQAGDTAAAEKSATEAKALVGEAKDAADTDADKEQLTGVERELTDLLDTATDVTTSDEGGTAFSDVPKEIQDTVIRLIDQALESIDPDQPVVASVSRLSSWVEGNITLAPTEIATLVADFLRERISPQ